MDLGCGLSLTGGLRAGELWAAFGEPVGPGELPLESLGDHPRGSYYRASTMVLHHLYSACIRLRISAASNRKPLRSPQEVLGEPLGSSTWEAAPAVGRPMRHLAKSWEAFAEAPQWLYSSSTVPLQCLYNGSTAALWLHLGPNLGPDRLK